MAEFMILSGIALISAIIFIASLSYNKNLYNTKDFFIVKDVALKIQNEISITSDVEDGYSREFTLPAKINNKDYNISIRNNNTLIVWTNTSLFAANILNITGSLKKEESNNINKITKSSGAVYVN